MSISGKISVGMRRIVLAPRITIKSAITTNVYGRLSARRTIHIFAAQAWRRAGECALGCGFPRGFCTQLPGPNRGSINEVESPMQASPTLEQPLVIPREIRTRTRRRRWLLVAFAAVLL